MLSQSLRNVLTRIHEEWSAHTARYATGGPWNTFRSLVSVLQVAGTFVFLIGFTLQFPGVLAWLPAGHWAWTLIPNVPELVVLAVFIVPEWLESMCFGKADATLRAYGVLNHLDTIRPGPSHSVSALQALWAGQVLGRLSNLAAHILLAAITSAALFLALRSLLQRL